MTAPASYRSYAEYLAHQADKLTQSGGEAFTNPDKMVRLFADRFRRLPIPDGQRVFCLGARRGEEVRAWQSLGQYALGIDLNPGANNPDVLHGDFLATGFPDWSVDVVYTNSMDHAYDWRKLVDEMCRIVQPDGWLVIDFQYGTREGYTFGEHDCCVWNYAREMADQIARHSGWPIIYWKDLGRRSWLPWERLYQRVWGRRLHPFVYQSVFRRAV